MASSDSKHIAKEILIEMIRQQNYLVRSEYPEAKTVTDMVCEAYKKILATVSEP